jgi:uncharacterized protein involved in exopolysaccharide biosynthesis
MDSSIEYTVGDYLAVFRRRRGLLLAVAIPVFACAVLISVFLPDTYTSSAQIDINLEGASAKTLEPIEVTSYADQYIAKLTDRALTRENLLGLVNDPVVFPGGQSGPTESEKLDEIYSSIEVSVLTQLVSSPASGREVDLISGFRVSSVGPDPERAFHFAQYVAKLFLDADRRSRTERASSATLFLSEQMSLTEKEIVELEKETADFKVANACCLPELVNLNTSVIQRAERDIADIRPRIRALEQDRIFLQSQLEEIRQLTSTNDHLVDLESEYMALVANYGPDHPDVIRMRREINAVASAASDGEAVAEVVELRMKLIEAEQKYSSEHPDVIRYKQQLAALEAQRELGGGAGRTRLLDNPRYIQVRAELNSIDTELSELRTREPELRQKIRDYEERLRRTPQVESEYQALTRRLESARDNYDDLQGRAVIARQSEALESTDIAARLEQVVAPSIPKSPSGPPRTAILILGIFLAGSLGVGSMLFAEMTDSTIRGSKDVVRVLNIVPLATIPVIENASSRKARLRKLYLIRGMTFLTVFALIMLYFRDFL